MPFLNLGQDFIRDLADHLCGQFDSIEVLELVMDIPCTHTPCIQRDDFFFNTGNITLIFWNKLWLKLTVTVSGNIQLKFPVLTFEGLWGMSVYCW